MFCIGPFGRRHGFLPSHEIWSYFTSKLSTIHSLPTSRFPMDGNRECISANSFIFRFSSTFFSQKVRSHAEAFLQKHWIFRLIIDGIKKELGSIILGTQIGVVVILCLWEIWAFDESIVTRDQKMKLNWCYVPFLVVPVIMVADMFGRVCKRVEMAGKIKQK